jgi:hypothetical protein
MAIIHDSPHAKYERCTICGMRKTYRKGYRGRVKNVEYLRDHVRNFAQKFGATKRIYNKIYKPETCIIRL